MLDGVIKIYIRVFNRYLVLKVNTILAVAPISATLFFVFIFIAVNSLNDVIDIVLNLNAGVLQANVLP
jgi:hypothetical protein